MQPGEVPGSHELFPSNRNPGEQQLLHTYDGQPRNGMEPNLYPPLLPSSGHYGYPHYGYQQPYVPINPYHAQLYETHPPINPRGAPDIAMASPPQKLVENEVGIQNEAVETAVQTSTADSSEQDQVKVKTKKTRSKRSKSAERRGDSVQNGEPDVLEEGDLENAPPEKESRDVQIIDPNSSFQLTVQNNPRWVVRCIVFSWRHCIY